MSTLPTLCITGKLDWFNVVILLAAQEMTISLIMVLECSTLVTLVRSYCYGL